MGLINLFISYCFYIYIFVVVHSAFTHLLIFIQVSVDTAHGYTPRAIDMSNVTLSRELHVSYSTANVMHVEH